MFDVIEFYSDPSDPRAIPFSRRYPTNGFHWRHYLKDASSIVKNGGVRSPMVWIIPPRQELNDLTPFLEYCDLIQDPEMKITRYHTYCRSKDGKNIRNAGPVLIPVDQLMGQPEKRVVHLDSVATSHLGYRVFSANDTDIKYSEFTWFVPEGCIVKESVFDQMIEPDTIDASKRYTFGTKALTRVGTLMAGPMLSPKRIGNELPEIVDGGYPTVGFKNPDKPVYDGVVISYHEDNTDALSRVKDKLNIHTVQDVKGIANAHYRALEASETDYAWIIDADCLVDDGFDFRFRVPDFYHQTIYVWASRNNVNGLEYPNGGLKLMPKKAVLDHRDADMSYLDFTESLGKFCSFHECKEVVGTTIIDATPYTAWKSGFREGYKLYWRSKAGDKLATERLDVWCSRADTENGKWAITGATHAVKNAKKISPSQINDYDWLRREWSKFC